ncbi:MAG: nucleoside hydrolase [Acidobacteria bacterium]|nr:nucleoside hydrolase [Acidobacteriota bacterium]
MKLFILIGVAVFMVHTPIVDAADAPVNIIKDTDIGNDTDDAMALAILHAFQSRHEANILAVTVSYDNKWAAPFADIINISYGRPDVPIGVVRPGSMPMTPENLGILIPKDLLKVLVERRTAAGYFVYPHNITDGRRAPDAISLLRMTLAGQQDEGVVMVQIGPSTNLARLLATDSDTTSPLDGRALVRRKVRFLSVMAGSFTDIQYDGRTYPKGHPEYNLQMDVHSAQRVFSDWPTPIVVTDCASAPPRSAASVERDFAYVATHPILEDLHLYTWTHHATAGWPEDVTLKWPRSVGFCDENAVLYAVRPDEGYFSLSQPGNITVLPDGGSRFEESKTGHERLLTLTDGQKQRAGEAMALLRSQPPSTKGRL